MGTNQGAGTHAPRVRHAEFRFYEELNDHLPETVRRKSFGYEFTGTPAVKDTIAAIGVPHVEVDLILVDRRSVSFSHHLQGGERVAVYPMFERLNVSPIQRLRPQPLRYPAFVLDVHLGRLAKLMRMLGIDTLYSNDLADEEIVDLALNQHRAILTRDKGILKNGRVTHGYWLRSLAPTEQITEVLEAFDLYAQVQPMSRCLVCNTRLARMDGSQLPDTVRERIRKTEDRFTGCLGCGRVYWKGSHHSRMQETIKGILARRGSVLQ